jgi:hypothetical protein
VSEELARPNTDVVEQTPARRRRDNGGGTAPNGGSPRPDQEEPDVVLDVENLEVEKITLEVDDLRAHISVLAELANLLNLSVGADVQLGRVKLEIVGVRAQAILRVRLENVRAILEKALETLGEHPEMLENLAQSLTALLRDTLQDASSELGDVLEGLDVGDTVDEVLKGRLEDISSDIEGALGASGRRDDPEGRRGYRRDHRPGRSGCPRRTGRLGGRGGYGGCQAQGRGARGGAVGGGRHGPRRTHHDKGRPGRRTGKVR